jgi:hypothetical protein
VASTAVWNAFLALVGRMVEVTAGTFQIELTDVVAPNEDQAVIFVNERATVGGREFSYKGAGIFFLEGGR